MMICKTFVSRILIPCRMSSSLKAKVNSRRHLAFTLHSTYTKSVLSTSGTHSKLYGCKRSFTTPAVKTSVKEEELFPLKYLFLRTSVDIWEECPHGLTFDVGYKDSQPSSDFNRALPTVVGLPGISETHEDLSDLLLPFAKLGCRVLIPNLPGNEYTKGVTQPDEDIFNYTIDEKSDFVNDFLDELGITRIDMLVTCHCSAYPGLKLTLKDPEKYRSLVMLNPAGVRLGSMMQPVKLYKAISRLWDSPVLRVFLKTCIFLVKPFTKHKGWKVRDVITFSRNVAGISYEEVADIVNHASLYPKPRFVIYSDSDKLYDSEIIDEMVQAIGIPKTAIQVIGDDRPKSDRGSNENASSVKSSAIDISRIQGVKFEGVKGDIKEAKASLIKKVLLDCLKTVKAGS